MYTKYKSLTGALMLFFLVSFCACGLFYYYLFIYPPGPEDQAIPLSNDVTTDLCLKLEIPETALRCQGNTEVYERDFYPDFRAWIDEGKLQTIEEWQVKFGRYQTECHEKYLANEDGIKPTECTFNFNEDKIYFITAEFVNGTLDRAFFLAPDSP